MTLRECQDKVVKDYNYDDWDHFVTECPGQATMQTFMESAAELYMTTNRDEAVREAWKNGA